MTEKTVNIKWGPMVVALLIAPAIATVVVIVLTLVYPPLLLWAALVGTVSLCLGYTSYLLLGMPLMFLAFAAGVTHPLLHAVLGFGAAWLIPVAHQAGLTFVGKPEFAELGQWFAPVWCATGAFLYTYLSREFQIEQEA